MFRVELKHLDSTYETFDYLRDYCRDTFGKNPRSGPRIWTSNYGWNCESVPSITWSHASFISYRPYPIFYFNTEENAMIFKLRWQQ